MKNSGVVARYVSSHPSRTSMNDWLMGNKVERRNANYYASEGIVRCYIGSEAPNGTKVEAVAAGRNPEEAFQSVLKKLLGIFTHEANR